MVKSRSDSRRRPSRTPGMAEWRRAAEARAEEMYNLMVPSAILTKLPPGTVVVHGPPTHRFLHAS